MKVKILNNDHYHLWADNFHDIDGRSRIHYFPGDVFEVRSYRHNKADFYEAIWETLSSKQRLLCPVVSQEPVFWIEKRVTVQVDDDENVLEFSLPKELFEV